MFLLTDRIMITSTVWTDDHTSLQKSNSYVRQPCKASLALHIFFNKLRRRAKKPGIELRYSVLRVSILSYTPRNNTLCTPLVSHEVLELTSLSTAKYKQL